MSFSNYRRPLYLYPLFQIPLIFLGFFLLLALLFSLFGFGRPPVAVAIALDLSQSTYGLTFNAPDSVMAREVRAVEAYLDKNTADFLREPNQVRVFGFANDVISLTSAFEVDRAKVAAELRQSLQPDLATRIGGGTNINLAIQTASQELSSIADRCRELLIVSDGEVSVDSSVIAGALRGRVRINAIVLNVESSELQGAAVSTGGTYLSGEVANLNSLFSERFFNRFNNNWRWLLLWLGLAWIALMWTLTMPLDRWVFQGILKMRLDWAGRLALGNALFWTVATPGIMWGIYRLLNLAVPFFSQC